MNRRNWLKRIAGLAAAPFAPVAMRLAQRPPVIPHASMVEMGDWSIKVGSWGWMREGPGVIRIWPPAWQEVGTQRAMEVWKMVVERADQMGIKVVMGGK